jgi:hypothetical protein
MWSRKRINLDRAVLFAIPRHTACRPPRHVAFWIATSTLKRPTGTPVFLRKADAGNSRFATYHDYSRGDGRFVQAQGRQACGTVSLFPWQISNIRL